VGVPWTLWSFAGSMPVEISRVLCKKKPKNDWLLDFIFLLVKDDKNPPPNLSILNQVSLFIHLSSHFLVSAHN
jgi:hypothetical protein